MQGRVPSSIVKDYKHVYTCVTRVGQASTPEEARELLAQTMEDVNPSEISFTERAAMRTQCRKLAKFMKVNN